jgi:hypothetical protein
LSHIWVFAMYRDAPGVRLLIMPRMWALYLGVLGMTLMGCGDSSPTPDTTVTLSTDGDITVGQGQAGTTTITATRVAGVSQAVTLGASGLPTGATATFVPTACTPTCTSTLTIATGAFTPPGSFPITVTGTPLAGMTTLTLVVNAVWTGLGPAGVFVAALALDPLTPTTLYAGTLGSGVFAIFLGEQ